MFVRCVEPRVRGLKKQKGSCEEEDVNVRV